MIKLVKDKYVLYNKDGTKKLFSSTSYAACIEKEKEIEKYKAIAREKRKAK